MTGEELYEGTEQAGTFRIFPFLNDSRSFDVVHNPQQAYEAARQFALFIKLVSGFDAQSLRITLPDFHNLSLRYAQFQEALIGRNAVRREKAAELIEFLQQLAPIVDTYEYIKNNPEFKIRVTHHDTKISNVLFDSEDNGLCVIDLDTVMPVIFSAMSVTFFVLTCQRQMKKNGTLKKSPSATRFLKRSSKAI